MTDFDVEPAATMGPVQDLAAFGLDARSAARILSVAQPWAWATAAGARAIENRSWGTNYRGLLFVQAPLRWSARGGCDPRIRAMVAPEVLAVAAGRWMQAPAMFARGAIVCVRELEDCHPAHGGCCRPWGEEEYIDVAGRRRTDIWHWVLGGVGHLEHPIECSGGLRLRRIPSDLLASAVPVRRDART
jgi:hypothetical protein